LDLVGFLFLQHGGQKLFGWFGGLGGDGQGVALFSLIGAAGLIEFIGGLFVILGLFTRLAALVVVIELIIAYVKSHAPKGWNPFIFGGNGGELALLFLAAFLVLVVYGSGKWGFEKALLKKEYF